MSNTHPQARIPVLSGAPKTRPTRSRLVARGVVAFAVAAALAIAAAGIAGSMSWVGIVEHKMHAGVFQAGATASSIGLARTSAPASYTVLLAAADDSDARTTAHARPVALLRVDPVAGRAWLLLLPADATAIVKGYGNTSLGRASSHGGVAALVSAVNGAFGVSVNHYVQVDSAGFEKLVDASGGVWLNVPASIDDVPPDGATGSRPGHLDAGYQLLDGERALTFADHEPGFGDPDTPQMRSGQALALALVSRAGAGIPGKLGSAWVIGSNASHIRTDMSLSEFVSMLSDVRNTPPARFSTAIVPGTWQAPVFSVNYAAVHGLESRMASGLAFGQRIESLAKGDAPPVVRPQTVTLAIQNGSGVSGLAAQCATILSTRGFRVKSKGNANQFVYAKTFVVYHAGTQAKAQAVAAALPFATVIPRAGKYAFKTDVLVVIGRDWVAQAPSLANVPVNAAPSATPNSR